MYHMFIVWKREFRLPPLLNIISLYFFISSIMVFYYSGLYFLWPHLGSSEVTPSRACPFGDALLLVSIIRKLG